MSSLETNTTTSSQSQIITAAWDEIWAELEAKKRRIYTQIGNYPSPIAGCDQQFNHLLEEQGNIVRALARLSEAENESLAAADPHRIIEEFRRSSAYREAVA